MEKIMIVISFVIFHNFWNKTENKKKIGSVIKDQLSGVKEQIYYTLSIFTQVMVNTIEIGVH